MGIRKVLGTLSICLVVASIILLATRGLNLGLDFTGGTTVVVEAPADIDIAQVRQDLEEAGFSDAVVQQYGSARDISVRVAPQEGMEADQVGQNVYQTLSGGIDDLQLKQVEFVGPQVGDELRDQSGLAMLMALGLMLVYVWFRFSNKFGIATVAALLHDVIIVLGLFSLVRWPFDLTVLAAVLALIGYSLNDSIVVADRIRENFRNTRETDPHVIVNGAISETLSRTINTSFTTILVLVALFFFGGEVMRAFSEALLVGIFVGTYSSIYVVANLLFTLGVSKEDFLIPEKEEIDEMP
ncbi:protein translocase subunit SecF [Alloalcanivorax profundimaris]|uniref:protein translocase subunit SecF n=1 Tax=Alloalcanivorax profundimaris TaxID=2735259 RepID=UPI00210BEE2D|nr:protein translocase subunit SecF [Alloalcanivorax profundimaris]MCQ6263012.1 protein translocase subunit SecF [Alcanivorax sp. MM125-6]|tara:strand:- start:393 stop:1286 length:894 start_codon:yes stop_codon:yes gene_type:complete